MSLSIPNLHVHQATAVRAEILGDSGVVRICLFGADKYDTFDLVLFDLPGDEAKRVLEALGSAADHRKELAA